MRVILPPRAVLNWTKESETEQSVPEIVMLRKLHFILALMAIVSVAATARASVNGSFRITGSEASGDSGTITVSFTDNNGRTYSESILYGQFSFKESVAAYFGGKFANDGYRYGMTAKAYGDTVVFNLRSASSVSSLTVTGPTTSFHIDGTNWPTSGLITPSVAVECTPDPVISGNPASCTASVAGPASGTVSFSLDGGAPWTTATLSGDSATVTGPLASAAAGYHLVTVQYSGDGTHAPTSGDTDVLVEGAAGAPATGEIYSFNITGYDGTGNILNYTHNVNGASSSFGYAYDALNRLSLGSQTPTSGSPQYFCWNYDSFGNRTIQAISDQSFGTTPGATCSFSGAILSNNTASYDTSSYATPGSNRISSTNASGTSIAPVYDSAGNIANDGTNSYLYDADGRLCAMQSGISILGGQNTIGYLYDAEGRRVAKGNLTSFSCDINSNGFSITHSYALGSSGEQVSETGEAGEWLHTNVNVGGTLLATYDDEGVHYHATDWLGSRRVQADYRGVVEGAYQNLPYGEFVPSNTSVELGATEHHFTGQERDAESGLDYFGARQYASAVGRFMSPDPSGLESANSTNPQSLNLYSYVLNNPFSFTDPTGLYCYWDKGSSDDDPEDGGASKEDCKTQGGTWTDLKNPCHGADGCTTTTTNDPKPMDVHDFSGYLGGWLAGTLPTNIVYLQNSGWTTDLRNGPGVKAGIADYTSRGCADRPDNQPFSPGHGAGVTTNLVQMETGDFNMSSSTYLSPLGPEVQFTVTNTSGQASWSGANANGGKGIPGMRSDGIKDNPYGPNGPRHNVNQTFVWTQSWPCAIPHPDMNVQLHLQ
jgi:RHS repeat-associated protein